MKTLLLTLGMAALLVRSSYAVEYVTLTEGDELAVEPTSLVECISSNSTAQIVVVFSRDIAHSTSPEKTYFGPVIGIGKVKLLRLTGGFNPANPTYNSAATFKITHANELNVVAPTSLLVIPENSTGNYNIVVETSSDMATWTPFHSQTVSAADAKRFFRTRIVKAQ
jgi:hypothetical protein